MKIKLIILFFIFIPFLGGDLYSKPKNKVGKKKLRMISSEEFKNIEKKQLALVSGVTQVLKFNFKMGNIATGNSGIADFRASPDRTQLLIRPRDRGVTNIQIYDTRDKLRAMLDITVTKADMAKVVNELQALLGNIEGIRFRVMGNRVVVDGEVLLPVDIQRIQAVTRQYPEVANIVTLSPVAQKVIAQKIEKDINKPDIHVRAVNGKFILEGIADSQDDVQIAERIAKSYVPDMAIQGPGFVSKNDKEAESLIINILKVRAAPQPEPDKQIKVVAHYVELSKDYEKYFGFSWMPGIIDNSSANVSTAGKITGTVTASISSLIPKLRQASQQEHAKILKTTTIIVKNNADGTTKSTVQYPFQTLPNKDGVVGIEYKDIGLTTTVTPTVIGNTDSVNLKIVFKFQAIVGETPQGNPTFREDEVITQVIIRSNESAAIGGVISQENRTSYDKLPKNLVNATNNGSDNFILNLYRSKKFNNGKSQLVVFVTPYIIESASKDSEALKKKFRVK